MRRRALLTGLTPSESIGRSLRRPLAMLDSIPVVGAAQPMRFTTPNARLAWAHRFRVYDTGAAMGLLLDRLSISWKVRLENGDDFPDVISDAIGLNVSQTPLEDIEATMERYDIEVIRRQVRALLEAAGEAHAAAIEARP